YAVTIREEILACTGRDVSRGSIYITLDRLETKGYLKSWFGDPTPERGGRAKRYYALRPRAVGALKESRRALVALWGGEERRLARCARHVPADGAAERSARADRRRHRRGIRGRLRAAGKSSGGMLGVRHGSASGGAIPDRTDDAHARRAAD